MSSGAEISEAFFGECVRPILDARFPGLGYVSARLGSGSDVLGYDDERSRDHDWGCRLTLLVDDDNAPLVRLVDDILEQKLPTEFPGHPTRLDHVRYPRTPQGRSLDRSRSSPSHGSASTQREHWRLSSGSSSRASP